MKCLLQTLFCLLLSFHTVCAQSWSDLNKEAVAAYKAGDYNAAIDWGKKALEQAATEFGVTHSKYAVSLNDLAVMYQDMGNYTQAELFYKQALEVSRKALGEEHPNYAANLNNLAGLYRAMGNYAQAVPLMKQALEIKKKALGEEHRGYAIALNSLAGVYDEMGNYAQAEPLYKQALEIIRKTLGEESPNYAAVLNNLAELYRAMGNYTPAEPLYKQALAIDKKTLGEEHPDVANDLNNLALLYATTGNYAQAEPLYKQALEIKRKALGDEHPAVAVSLNNLAEMYRETGNYAQAEPLYKQALEIRRKTLGEEHPAFATGLNNLALLYDAMGNYTAAELLYKQALEIRKKTLGDDHPDFAGTLSNLAYTYMNTGAYAKAAILLDSGNHILLSNIGRNYTFLSEKEKEKYNTTILGSFESYSGFVYKHHAAIPSSVTQCFNNILATSSLLLKSNIAISHAIKASTDTALKQLYAAWVEKRRTIAGAYNLSIAERKERGINTRLLEEQAQEIEKKLVKSSTAFTTTNRTDIDYAKVRSALNNGEAIIEFSGFRYYNGKEWTDSTLYCAYIIKKNESAPVYVPLFEEKELQPLLAGMRSSGRGLAIENTNTPATGAAHKTLYSLVWEKLEPHLKKVSTIYLVPSGLLHKVSFERIQDERGTYLLNKYDLHHILGSSEIVYLKESRQAPKEKNIALLGGARFDLEVNILQQQAPTTPNVTDNAATAMRSVQRDGNTFAPWRYLKGTLDEVLAINSTLTPLQWHCSLDTGSTATEEQLLALTGNNAPEIMHIATHGFYLPPPHDSMRKRELTGNDNVYKTASNPLLRSGIVLSGANHKWVDNIDIPGAENGIVTALDISNMDLSNTSLVTLSACETGLGDIQSGEGVYGLQRAFRLAGVENMIISLWQVPDKETAEMMALFYQNLAKENATYYDAFHAAQRQMQQNYPTEPLKWAAFKLVGQ